MARDPVELEALTRDTALFIASDPTAIVFRRRQRIDDGAGGWTEGPLVATDPQVVKLQPITSLKSSERLSTAGVIMRPTHMVVGMPGLNAEDGDNFLWNGQEWGVVFADKTQQYIVKAEVIRGGH